MFISLHTTLFIRKAVLKQYLLALASAGFCQLGFAGLATPSDPKNDSSELVFVIQNPDAKTSYTLDLGVRAKDFFVVAQQDSGYQRFWVMDPDAPNDHNWATFRSLAGFEKSTWAVFGGDAVIGTDGLGQHAPGGVQLFTTAQKGKEANFIQKNATPSQSATSKVPRTLMNSLFGAGSDSLLPKFFTDTNLVFGLRNGNDSKFPNSDQIADNFSILASSSMATNKGAYFGDTGQWMNPSLVKNKDFAITNTIGETSWFYYLTNKDSSLSSKANSDEFDNLYGDGFWGFVKEAGDSQRYLLSYTLKNAAGLAPLEKTSSINNNAKRAGDSVLLGLLDTGASFSDHCGLPTSKGMVGTDLPNLFALDIQTTAAAVPEPQSFALLLAGLTGLAAFVRRRKRLL